jgi:hypothetical protein
MTVAKAIEGTAETERAPTCDSRGPRNCNVHLVEGIDGWSLQHTHTNLKQRSGTGVPVLLVVHSDRERYRSSPTATIGASSNYGFIKAGTKVTS